MTSDKKTVSLLADLFVKKGLTDIVISPGSRNAPIILAFANHPKINALSVVDERSAAFFALGMAQQSGKTVAIACTSGSAPLNYAPAIAEAYYQKIPLLILTADRPPEMIDVGDGQTIRQENVFANFIKKSIQLPLDIEDESAFEEVNKTLNEAIHQTVFPVAGPVHINIPFDEPLYGVVSEQIESRVLKFTMAPKEMQAELEEVFVSDWLACKKVMILVGQHQPSQELNQLLQEFSSNKHLVVLSETTSNLNGSDFIDSIDNLLSAINDEEASDFQPDMLISIGGAIVSKQIKKFLRKHRPKAHWHIDGSGEKRDTFYCLSHAPAMEPVHFLKAVLPKVATLESSYQRRWLARRAKVEYLRHEYLSHIKYSDLKVFDILLNHIPADSLLHLGNSTPVRYSQLFGSLARFQYLSNRGVSGIDGQISTAAGSAFISRKLNTIISGDLGFFYDSNALMNHYLPANLKIIVINNGGGGIFRFIPGPDSSNHLEKFFEARHSWKAEHLALAFDVHYFKAENEETLTSILPEFYAELSRPALLEIFTPPEENAKILRDYFVFLKTAGH